MTALQAEIARGEERESKMKASLGEVSQAKKGIEQALAQRSEEAAREEELVSRARAVRVPCARPVRRPCARPVPFAPACARPNSHPPSRDGAPRAGAGRLARVIARGRARAAAAHAPGYRRYMCVVR